MFKKIPGFSRYSIDINGNAKVIETNAVISWHWSNGYRFAKLVDDFGNKVSIGQHRVLALTYIPKPNTSERLDVNHIDNIRSNNRIDNLEWVTRSYNTKHGYQMLKKDRLPVIVRDKITGERLTFNSRKEACKALGWKYEDLFDRNKKFSIDHFEIEILNEPIEFTRIVENPRGVCARNILTGKIILAANTSQLAELIGVHRKVLRRIFKNERFDYPINGYDVRVIEDDIEWPTYTLSEIEAFKDILFIHNPTWVIDEQNNRRLFGSVLLAEEYTKTGQRTIRFCVKNGVKCTRGFRYEKHVRKVNSVKKSH